VRTALREHGKWFVFQGIVMLVLGCLAVVEPVIAGPVAELVGIEGGVVSGVINLESSGVEASDWRPRHDGQYYEA
jgi:uncharacterized membrane protein HdeD (DUF308 family)